MTLQKSESDLQALIKLAGSPRTVKTAQGQKKFGEAIGSQIKKDAPKTDSKPPTITRLVSLKDQMEAAQSAGDKSALGDLEEKFLAEFRQLSAKRSSKDILQELKALSDKNPKKT